MNELNEKPTLPIHGVSCGYNIVLKWVDFKKFNLNPSPSNRNVNTVAEYYLNDMMLVDIYEGTGFYEINSSILPMNRFGGAYETNRFRKIELAKKYVEKNVNMWLCNNHS